ncbi:MAG: hypothetical protein UV67_C0017G0002 [Parcubacteria group bacterium GW2011_GWC1_43_12]|nr:MAG: hypothetical protein UV67_C0017G0002 [Parcubacteria group bacterium GW2011_GWC1_43_12]
MKDYIKQNWRNLTISILVIGFVLLMIFSNSPIDKQDNSAQPSATPLPETSLQNNQTNSSDIFIKTKEECGKSAKKLFDHLKTIDITDRASSYIYQFNSERCYVLVTFSKNDNSSYVAKELNILYFPEEIHGAFIGHYSKDQDDKITFCQVREYETANWVYCQNEEEFNRLMKDSGYIK